MAHKKLQRFAEIVDFPNVLIYPENMPGRWREHFNNDQPITLELACGKGEYTVNLAKRFPERNFIGVDLKGNRIWKGAKQALDEKIPNVAFLRTQIDKITNYFKSGEVEEIWITFPDPFLRKSRAKKRLTYQKFLRLYQQILTSGGTINLKTDSPELFAFTLEVIEAEGCQLHRRIDNVYEAADAPEVLTSIQTFYEQMHLAENKIIRYLQFSLPEKAIVVKKQKQESDAEIS